MSKSKERTYGFHCKNKACMRLTKITTDAKRLYGRISFTCNSCGKINEANII